MEGEAEYGFWHLLVRDVCYAQIPRAARAARHGAAAAWIERKAGERAEDLADVLAHHYLTALELAARRRPTEDAKELEASAIRYLALAGERALALDVESAEASLAKALALARPATRSEPACSSAGRTRRSKRVACEKRRRRSRRRSSSIASVGTASPPEGHSPRLCPCSRTSVTRTVRSRSPRRSRCWKRSHPGPSSSPPTASSRACTSCSSVTIPEAIVAAEQALELAAELQPTRARTRARVPRQRPRLPG